jgi:chemotaxis protein methyltransferase CheR
MQEPLSIGDTQRVDYEAFKRMVFRKCGVDLNLYKQQQMHRRLHGMVERANLKTFAEYFQLIDRDPAEWAAFLDRMTINVSELFRNPEKWEELKTQILPLMLRRGRPLRVWSAGCSFGAEPYTIAMLLDELSPGLRHTIVATDIDRKILERAQQGLFTEADVKNVPLASGQKYLLRTGDRYQVVPSLRQRIVFRAHNLLADPFEPNWDLIVCRNVVIYFTEEAKDRLFARFVAALNPGGVLFVGGTERIFDYQDLGLDSRIPFFYERVR